MASKNVRPSRSPVKENNSSKPRPQSNPTVQPQRPRRPDASERNPVRNRPHRRKPKPSPRHPNQRRPNGKPTAWSGRAPPPPLPPHVSSTEQNEIS